MAGELIVGVEKEVGTFTDEHGVTHKRYVKIVDCGVIATANTDVHILEDTDYLGLLSVSGVAVNSNDVGWGLDFINAISTDSFSRLYVNKTSITVRCHTPATQVYVTLEYYK